MAHQETLFGDEAGYVDTEGIASSEDPTYLSGQLVTYIGNKRSLLPQIGHAVEQVRSELGGRRLRVLDAFAGSGVVSRYFKRHSELLHSNDFETYARVIGECFLANASSVDLEEAARFAHELNERFEAGDRAEGFFSELYAPRDTDHVRPDERCFYSADNAARLNSFRAWLDEVPDSMKTLLLGPLLAEASVHVNTGGVFKGFYKDRSGVGKFGGTGGNALQRILSPIRMAAPVLSRFECETVVHQQDANLLAANIGVLDLAYVDPPYNQHPYGSNYFMLNLLVTNQRPVDVSLVSGIPKDWQRSVYNQRRRAFDSFRDFTDSVPARFLLVSYSDEGFIPPEKMRDYLESLGSVREIKTSYAAYRASRNLGERSLRVTEHLFLVDKQRRAYGKT
jgi:adenine-specific DNA-methyltransferase